MKNILLLISILSVTGCVKVETEGTAHEAGNLIRDGVKESYNIYKESKSKKDSVMDTIPFWDKTRNTIKEMKKTIKVIKE